MKNTNHHGRLALLVLLALSQATPSLAQFDDFPPPPDMNEPALPTPPPAAQAPTTAPQSPTAPALPADTLSTNHDVGTSHNGKDKSVLHGNQKTKFANAATEDINDQNFPETIESFDFPNVEITDVIKAISELTGKNFIIDPAVRGKITIVAPSKITVAEAYKAFLSSLAINGYTVVPSGSFIQIKSARNAQRDSIETYSGSYYPTSNQMITKIFHLKHISAEQVNRELRILPSKDGEMVPYPPTNSLIISDYGGNIDRIAKIINQLDVPNFEDQIEIVNVKFAKAKDMAELLDRIINKGEKRNSTLGAGGFSSGVPRYTSGSTNNQKTNQGANFFVIPDDRTNSLIVVGNKAGILRVRKLVAQLDFKLPAGEGGGVYVYYVKHGDAENIAKTLQGVTKDAGPKAGSAGNSLGGGSLLPPINPATGQTTSPQDFFGGDVKITSDKNTNSLVITASKQDYENVLTILRQLDIRRDQVFVETIIMEMSINDKLDTGAGFYQFYEPSGKIGFSTSTTDAQSFLSPLAGGSAILGFAGSKTVTIKDPVAGKDFTLPNLIGFINFLKTFGRTNILSTPSIVAVDNQEAEISVGDKVVVGTQATPGANGANPTVTPQFEDALIELKIKPFISPQSNTIRMEVQQKSAQLSTISVPKFFEGQVQPLAKRSIKTSIIVNEGDTAVLGGLMKDEEIETIRKVPLLGDLPIIGWLFKGKSSEKKKVNMLVFLSPKIIRTTEDSKQILGRKLDERLGYVRAQGGRDPFGKKLEEVTRKADLGKKEELAPENAPQIETETPPAVE